MNHIDVHAFTRWTSPLTLGTAGMASVFSNPIVTDAKRNHGKKEDANNLYKKQVGQRTTFFTTAGKDNPDGLIQVEQCRPSSGVAISTASSPALRTGQASGVSSIRG